MSDNKRKCLVICLLALFLGLIGIVFPEAITPTPITYINASEINTTGATATGSVQNITDINNGYYNVTEINAQPYYVLVNFTNITNFSFLEVKAKYFSVSGTPSTHIVDVEIYCTTDNEYEDVFFLENANEWRYFTRHFPDSMHFIDAQGNVSIKLNHSSNGNVNHRLFIDTVRLIILPQYALNTINLTQNINQSGCSGNCSFNNLTTNSLGKNDTTDSYGNYINLKSGLKTVFTPSSINNTIDLYSPDINLFSLNTISGNYSNVLIGTDRMLIQVANAHDTDMLLNHSAIELTIFGQRYVFNDTALNLLNKNLTNCGNCGGNQNLSQVLIQGNDANLQNITNLHDVFQEFSDINMTIDNNCEDSGAPPIAKNCPRTLQQLKTNYSNVTIRHRLNPANENYGITLNTKPDLSLDNSSLAGWGVFFRSLNDDFYIGRFKPGYSEFIWRALNNDTVVFYNNVNVTKNITVSGLAGIGTRAACLDDYGKIVASTNTSSGYKTC